MSDGVLNEWLDKRGNTEEDRDFVRQVVSILMEDDPPYIPPGDEPVADCEGCGKELTRDEVAYHEMEDDTGAWFYWCHDCAPRGYGE